MTTVLVHGLTLQFITSESFSYYTGSCARDSVFHLPPVVSPLPAGQHPVQLENSILFLTAQFLASTVKIEVPGQQTLRLKLACSMFISDWDWGQHLGRDGKYPQREKFSHGASLRMTCSTPWGALESRYQWKLSCVVLEHVGLYLPCCWDIEDRLLGSRIVNLELWIWRRLYPEGKEVSLQFLRGDLGAITPSIPEVSCLSKVSSIDLK